MNSRPPVCCAGDPRQGGQHRRTLDISPIIQYDNEERNSSPFASEHPVDPFGSDTLLAFPGLLDSAFAYTLYEVESHIRHSCAPVHPAFFFHLGHNVLDHLKFIVIQPEFFEHKAVAFDDLGCSKPYGDVSSLGMVLYYVLLRLGLPSTLGAVLCIALVILLRFFATKYRWNMPHAEP